MSHKGRGSAALSFIGIIMMLNIAALNMQYCEALIISVGGNIGYVASWVQGKKFRAGDSLEFKYNPAFHNVVVVDKEGYDRCRTPNGAKALRSGNDEVKLAKGMNYFICNVPGHCESGMKLAVKAV